MPIARTLEQYRCRNGECREDVLPVRVAIMEGEVQVRCRRCKSITVSTYQKGILTYATVIAGIRAEGRL